MRPGAPFCLLVLACLCSVACTRAHLCQPPRTTACAPRSTPVTSVDSAPAGTGAITGEVFDAKTKGALAGVAVILMGADSQVATNEHGEFLIGGIDPGAFGLMVVYLGYEDKLVRGTVAASCTLHLRIGLRTQILDIRGH
ncbi:carboxypeptidase-like regulatory domain-containing protein [candidate division WOR-3 bacterium]|nr:carboxypeptidase-like regulatory domain-containing protein [candidate division WOR-3 bacterium]